MTKDKKSGQLQGRLRCWNVYHCFYCYYHLTTGELAYSNSGQHLALSFMADGSIRKLVHNHGTALGIIPGLTYKQDTEKHEPGQILILYIDGVTEPSSLQNEMYGLPRFVKLVCSHKNLKLSN